MGVFFIGLILGIASTVLFVVFDKTVRLVKSDEVVLKKQDIINLQRAYSLAMRRIDPDFDSEESA